jgi:LysM repeat protein
MAISVPIYASAGFLSFLGGLIKGPSVSGSSASVINSQNMELLKAVVNPDPHSGKGGGDITIVADSALLAESGPNGSVADEDSFDESSQVSVYVVRSGDTLSGIAKMYNVSVNTILWSNDIKGGVIHEGDTLIILPISGVQLTVKKGDTLETLAKKYRGDADEIARYNGLALGQTLAIGSTLIIPDGEMSIANRPCRF